MKPKNAVSNTCFLWATVFSIRYASCTNFGCPSPTTVPFRSVIQAWMCLTSSRTDSSESDGDKRYPSSYTCSVSATSTPSISFSSTVPPTSGVSAPSNMDTILADDTSSCNDREHPERVLDECLFNQLNVEIFYVGNAPHNL